MKKSSASKIAGIIWAILWRVGLTCIAAAIVICAGCAILLDCVFNGPSESARDALTLTLLQYESTEDIPSRFLEQSVIDAIRTPGNTLTDTASDPALIQRDESLSGQETFTFEGKTYTAQIILAHDLPNQPLPNVTTDGILVLSTAAEDAEALEISQILILNGQVNDGLFESPSGYAARTAVGQRSDGTLILVTTSGGTKDVPGCTWQDLINIMAEYGAVNAYCVTGSTNTNEG